MGGTEEKMQKYHGSFLMGLGGTYLGKKMGRSTPHAIKGRERYLTKHLMASGPRGKCHSRKLKGEGFE